MKTLLKQKSTLAEIQKRFDTDVERFSDLETVQEAIIDAPLMMELIAKLAHKLCPEAKNLLDIGCGAGNNTIKIVRGVDSLNCDLNDLSMPMLERAKLRLESENTGRVRIFHGDFRKLALKQNHYDIVVAAAVLHHLREETDWEYAFRKIYDILLPKGAFFVSDMVFHECAPVHESMWSYYGNYLESIGGKSYCQKVFDYIDKEDSPRSLTFQIELLRKVGFKQVDILHKNSCFAAYVAIK